MMLGVPGARGKDQQPLLTDHQTRSIVFPPKWKLEVDNIS